MSEAQPESPVLDAEPREIADGVWVVPGGYVPLVPNVGIVVGDERVLVVDTAMGPVNGARVRSLAERLAGGRELVLTITHFHPEHGFGAQAFRGLPIVYNAAQLSELRTKGAAYLANFRTFGDAVAAQLEGFEFVEPTETYDGDRHVLDLGGRTVELRTWGQAHTLGDEVVWLPEERILFTGDLVEERCFAIFPFFPPDDADVDGEKWLGVLDRLEALGPRVVVPGHGELGGVELVRTVRDFITSVREESLALAAAGVDVEDAVERIDASMRALHPDWTQAEWIGFGVRQTYDSRSSRKP